MSLDKIIPDERERKNALKYIKAAYPEVYGDKTVLEISVYLNDLEKEEKVERNLAGMPTYYAFIPAQHMKATDTRQRHYRGITADGLVMFWDKAEQKPNNITRFALSKGEVKKYEVDLSTVQGLYMLVYWLEHPLVKVYGIENPFLTSAPMCELRVRGNVIKHDFELLNENYAIGQEILAISSMEDKKEAAMELSNMASFLGMNISGLTQAELIIGMLGKAMDGVAYTERAKYRRYQALNADEKDLEIAFAKAIEYKFIQDTGTEGWKMDDGTLLGGDRGQALAYLREKKSAFNKLMERVRVHAAKTPSISDVEELVAKPSDGVRQTKNLRPDKKTVVEA